MCKNVPKIHSLSIESFNKTFCFQHSYSPHQVSLVEGFRVASEVNGLDDLEDMDTTAPVVTKRSTSPAIATKNTAFKQAAYPGSQNRPPHLRMN